MAKRLGNLALVGLGALIGLGIAWILWRPPASSRSPVSQLNALLLDFALRPLPRPSSEIEPGAILSGDLGWVAAPAQAWKNPAGISAKAHTVVPSATYRDAIDARGSWRATLPGLGPAASAAAALGLGAARWVETDVENVELREVPELTLAPDQLTPTVADLLPRGLVVVRVTCRIGRLRYRFLDGEGRTLKASLDTARATVGGDVRRVDTNEGTLVLEDVCVAVGPCTFLYQVPAFETAAARFQYLASLRTSGIPAPDAKGVVRIDADPLTAAAATRSLESKRLLIEFDALQRGAGGRLDASRLQDVRRELEGPALRPLRVGER